ncbi:mannosyl-glycoendo-beta-N-acetylglucosaminidase family protein, partial [Vibrio harveyi]
MAAIT